MLYGKPEVMRFQDGRSAAFSLQFDDSMASQIKNALPLLKEYGYQATFFINPGKGYYAPNRRVWEEDIIKAGHEVGNHTFTHSGAKDAVEAEREIRGCAEVIARVYGKYPRLIPFMIPGGVPWNVSDKDLKRIFIPIRTYLAPRTAIFADGWGNGDPTTFPQSALHNRIWSQIAMHGVEGEWISTSKANLTQLLNYLTRHQSDIWTATTTDVYKYVKERDALHAIILTEATDTGFSLQVQCDEAKVDTFGLSFTTLYNMPLTVRVNVPASWKNIRVTQGDVVARYAIAQNKAVAQFAVLPNLPAAQVRRV